MKTNNFTPCIFLSTLQLFLVIGIVMFMLQKALHRFYFIFLDL